MNEEILDVCGPIVEDEVAVQADEKDIGDQGGKFGHDPAAGIQNCGDEDQRDDVSHVLGEALQEGDGD